MVRVFKDLYLTNRNMSIYSINCLTSHINVKLELTFSLQENEYSVPFSKCQYTSHHIVNCALVILEWDFDFYSSICEKTLPHV